MGRRDPDFTADGLYFPDDLSAMRRAFQCACVKVGALADSDEVRWTMALVISHHYEMGIRRTDRMAEAAAKLGETIAEAKVKRALTSKLPTNLRHSPEA